MLYFTRWKAAAIVLTAVFICLFAVPNFLPEKMVASWPKWAQRHVVLGLDLQGGSHILLEVDTKAVRKEMLQSLLDDMRRVLREARIGYTGLVVKGNSVEVHIREGSNAGQALEKLRTLSQPLGGILSATGQRNIDVTTEPGNVIRLTYTDPAIVERVRQAVDQSIEIIGRRVNELGTVEPLIQREGTDRVLVQVPGLQDPTRLKQLLGKTAKLDFRMVDSGASVQQAQEGQVPPDDELLHGTGKDAAQTYLVEKRVLVSGADLTDAQPGFDQRTSEPIVSFRFNTSGARKFAAGDAGERRQAVRHRARQRGDFRAGDPRADPRRLRADFRQLHGAERQRSRHPAARRRAAGAAHHHRGAHRRPRPRRRLDRQGQDLVLRRRGHGRSSSCWRPTGCSGCSPISRWRSTSP